MATWNVLKKDDGLYNGIAWGTSYEKAKEILEEGADSNDSLSTYEGNIYEYADNYAGIDNLTASIVYSFNENGLYGVYVDLMNTEDDAGYTEKELYDKIKNLYTIKYGKGFEEEYEYHYVGRDGSRTQITWETEKSKIEVGEDSILGVYISYAGIDYTE